MKKMAFSEKRDLWIDSMIQKQKNWSMSYSGVIGGRKYNYQDILDELSRCGDLPSNDLDTNIVLYFGKPEEGDDFEYKIATIIFLHLLILFLPSIINKNEKQANDDFLEKIETTVDKYAPEFKIAWNRSGLSSYKAVEQKTIIDNIQNIDEKIATPIEALLQPMKSDTELRGHIAEAYAKIEKINIDKYNIDNEVDKSIASHALKLAKKVANNVDSAKGHEGQSRMTVRDIAHNFALNVSIVWKIIDLYNK